MRSALTRPDGLLALGLSLAAISGACAEPPDFPAPKTLIYLNQGERWQERERALFYFTPQGTELYGMRYAWFQQLEVSPGKRLADPDFLSRFGFLYSPEQFDENFDGGDLNPGNLPAGFARHESEITGEAMLDVSCALCHTGQLEYRGVSLRVDGGQAMHAMAWMQLVPPRQFLVQLLRALNSTYANPLMFDSFAQRVLGTRYPTDKAKLREELRASLEKAADQVPGVVLYADAGYGRLDALGRIADTVFGEDIDLRNEKKTNAPVSYPHLWDIWKFDWVQWNGSVAQPMGRNVAEALGVKARLELVDDTGNAVPPEHQFDSSVLVRELNCVETTLWQLGPPRWPREVFPAIDVNRAERGRELFQSRCQHCHGPHVYPERPRPPLVEPVRYDCEVHENEAKPTPEKPVEWKLCVVPTWDIGTDPTVVDNLLDNRYDASAIDPNRPELRSVSAGETLELLMREVSAKKYAELGLDEWERWEMDGWGREAAIRDMRGYKSRPLHGVWATPPFLHNGSVRTVYQLLSPASERESEFWVGSREYDPIRLGYENREVSAAYLQRAEDVGNSNAGHQFTDAGGLGVIGPLLSHEERMELIEYLKILGNPAYAELDPDYEEYAEPWAGPVRCEPGLQGPAAHPELTWPL